MICLTILNQDWYITDTWIDLQVFMRWKHYWKYSHNLTPVLFNCNIGIQDAGRLSKHLNSFCYSAVKLCYKLRFTYFNCLVWYGEQATKVFNYFLLLILLTVPASHMLSFRRYKNVTSFLIFIICSLLYSVQLNNTVVYREIWICSSLDLPFPF